MIHKYTWTQPTRNLRRIIDYVIQRQSSKIRTRDVRVYKGAECGTDHYILKAVMAISYRKQYRAKNNNSEEKNIVNGQNYNLAFLNDESIRFLYKSSA